MMQGVGFNGTFFFIIRYMLRKLVIIEMLFCLVLFIILLMQGEWKLIFPSLAIIWFFPTIFRYIIHSKLSLSLRAMKTLFSEGELALGVFTIILPVFIIHASIALYFLSQYYILNIGNNVSTYKLMFLFCGGWTFTSVSLLFAQDYLKYQQIRFPEEIWDNQYIDSDIIVSYEFSHSFTFTAIAYRILVALFLYFTYVRNELLTDFRTMLWILGATLTVSILHICLATVRLQYTHFYQRSR